MANVYWKGGATAIAQVTTFTPSDAPDAGDTTTIQATDDEGGNYTLSVTGVASVKDLVEAFVTAATAAKTAGYSPWDEVTATENDTVLTLTVTTAGKPIYFTGTAGAGETFTEATATANSGPYDWNTLANWIDADGIIADNLPGADASDTVYIEGDGTTNPIIKYGLDQLATIGANTLTALYATKCQIGSNGQSGYSPNYLQVKATKIEINYNYIGTANYSSPINIDNSTIATTINVYNSATANSPTTEPCVNLKVVEATSDIYIHAGKVGIAYHAGEVSTVDNIYILGSTAYAYLGSGITTTGGMIEQRAGYCYDRISVATEPEVNIYGGAYYKISNSAVTITALNSIGGITDLTGVTGTLTVTTWKVGDTATAKYNIGMTTLTNKIQPYETSGDIQYTAASI